MSDDVTQERLSPPERRIMLGVVIAACGSMLNGASFNFVIHPIVISLQASETQASLLRQLPGISGVLAIFVAGVLVMRVGPRRCLKWAGLLMIIGYMIACVAPNMGILSAGLVVAYIGKAAVLVIVVSLIASSIKGKGARATAFATFAMVAPGVSVAMPTLASFAVDNFGWRSVAVIWLLGGVLVIVTALTLIPADRGSTHQHGELWTPVLAGVVLVGLTQVANLATQDGIVSTSVLIVLGAIVVALVLLTLLIRNLPNPSMSFSVFRNGGLAMLFVVVLFIPFSNLWFYGTLGGQYIYGLSALAVSLIFIPVQLAGVAGANFSGRLAKARGLTFAGTATMLATVAMSFLCVIQTLSLPIIFPILILMVYGACVNGTLGTLTNSVMSMARKGQEAESSAFRSAAFATGSSLGAVFLTTIVFSTMAVSISDNSSAAGLNSMQSEQIANDMREGATSEDAASQYTTPLATVDEIQQFERQAAVEGFRVQGIASGMMLLTATGIFYLTRRKIDRREAAREQDVSADA